MVYFCGNNLKFRSHDSQVAAEVLHVHKQHELNKPSANLMKTIFHWLALGLALSPLGFALDPVGFTLGQQVFLNTNMLVLVTQSLAFGAYTNASPQRKPILVLVEYRLNSLTKDNDT